MSEKIIKADSEWRETLTEEQFRVARKHGTEPAFSGRLDKHWEKGVYRCICCDNPLFSSDTKFDSGSGWPSFLRRLMQLILAKRSIPAFLCAAPKCIV